MQDLILNLGNYKNKADELCIEFCPFCHGGQHRDKWKFFLNPVKETYYCQRGKCKTTGHISQLYAHFGIEYKRDNKRQVKKNNGVKGQNKVNETYKVFNDSFELIQEEDKGFKYLQLRGLDLETIRYFQIKKDKKGNIIFPFYHQKNLTCIKYRIPQKTKKNQLKTWQEKGGKAILFNYDNIDFSKPLIITEGEIDCMCIYQSGFQNVCSIPLGVNNFDWIDIHWDQLKKVPYFIICGDNDEAGKKFIDECVLKLGINKIKIIDNPYNDINEYLYKESVEKLRELICRAKNIEIDGLIKVSEIDKYKIDKSSRIDTGFKSLNKVIGGFLQGQFIILSGKRGNGKSTLSSQFIIEAINKGFNCCIYSGELTKELFKHWLLLQILGENVRKEWDDFRGKEVEIIPDEYWEKLNKWIDNKLWIYDNTVLERKKLDQASILKIFEYAAKRHNCKLFVVDNLMTARNQYDSNKDFYKSQGEFIGTFKKFSNDFNNTVIFIAHPKKNDNKSDFKNDDIAGSSENTDRPDVVLVLQKLDDDEKDKYNCDSLLHINKNRLYGDEGTIKLNFIKACKQFVEDKVFPKQYIDLNIESSKELEIKNFDNDEEMPWEVG